MDMKRVKTIGGAAVGAIVLAIGGYFYGTTSATPELVTVSNLGCGSPAGSANFDVPLITVTTGAPTMSVSYGVLDLPATNKAVRLTFDRAVDGKGNEVALIGDTLHLPLTFGRNDATPTTIRISCRDGAITSVRYQRDRANATFNVVRQTVSEIIEEIPQRDSTEG